MDRICKLREKKGGKQKMEKKSGKKMQMKEGEDKETGKMR